MPAQWNWTGVAIDGGVITYDYPENVSPAEVMTKLENDPMFSHPRWKWRVWESVRKVSIVKRAGILADDEEACSVCEEGGDECDCEVCDECEEKKPADEFGMWTYCRECRHPDGGETDDDDEDEDESPVGNAVRMAEAPHLVAERIAGGGEPDIADRLRETLERVNAVVLAVREGRMTSEEGEETYRAMLPTAR